MGAPARVYVKKGSFYRRDRGLKGVSRGSQGIIGSTNGKGEPLDLRVGQVLRGWCRIASEGQKQKTLLWRQSGGSIFV